MSQIDNLHFLPTLIWIIILFICWYLIIISLVLPTYYKTIRSRYLFENNLWKKMKEKELILNLLDKFYSIWMSNIVKNFRLLNIIWNFKNLLFLQINILNKNYIPEIFVKVRQSRRIIKNEKINEKKKN